MASPGLLPHQIIESYFDAYALNRFFFEDIPAAKKFLTKPLLYADRKVQISFDSKIDCRSLSDVVFLASQAIQHYEKTLRSLKNRSVDYEDSEYFETKAVLQTLFMRKSMIENPAKALETIMKPD
jgi:hypothetical protein